MYKTNKSYSIFVIKSKKNFTSYLYDINNKRCVFGISSKSLSLRKDFNFDKRHSVNIDMCKKIGENFAKKLNSIGIKHQDLYFDRKNLHFHGKVKSFLDSCFFTLNI